MIRSNLNINNRALFLIKIILFYFILSLKCYSDNSDVSNSFVVLGQDKAIIKIKVLKFGGSSVANSQNISKVVQIVSNTAANSKVAVVVSAFGKTTNKLIQSKMI